MYCFEEDYSFYIEIGLFIVFLVGYVLIERKKNFKLTLQYILYSYGVAMLLLCLKIPHVFSGFPYDISDIDNKKRLLLHLKKNNEVLMQTTETFRTMGFITFALLGIINFRIIKNLKAF
ncbi:hypothetical protein [Flavobacterium sp.]|jgi:hypothetical protein|uniref:hypothetical protein n=1 Tax=Flavobacterium sp. TaxID=239 RepID=UPI0035B40D6A